MSREAFEKLMAADFSNTPLRVVGPNEPLEAIDDDELTEDEKSQLVDKLVEGMLGWGDPNINYLSKPAPKGEQ